MKDIKTKKKIIIGRQIFNSVIEAAQFLDVKQSTISQALRTGNKIRGLYTVSLIDEIICS